MLKIKRVVASITALSITASCTAFHEQDIPSDLLNLVVSEESLEFPEELSAKNVTVLCGYKWQITDKPDWLRVASIDNQRASYYEWAVSLAPDSENVGYDRSGSVVFEAVGQSSELTVTQYGKKGPYIAVESIRVHPGQLTMTEGDTQTLAVEFVPLGASEQSVRWSSSNESVATVSSGGVVTAKTKGTAKITVVSDDGGKKANCTVTVNEKTVHVESVSLDNVSMTMEVGETQRLKAVVYPSDAIDKSVTWSSNNISVATVSSTGYVTAQAAGTATITVMTKDGGKKASCVVTVTAKTVSVSNVSLNEDAITMEVGDSQSLTATIYPADATDKSVTWSSNKTSVATVSSTGVVTAKAVGTATITVKTNDGGKTVSCGVTVKAKTVSVTGVTLDNTSLSMAIGDTKSLTATVSPSNATDKSVTWSSNNTSVATVSSSGVVTAKAAGTATITVKTNDGGKTATCTVTVSATMVSVTGVSLDRSKLTLTEGFTKTLTATITPANATNKEVKWTSSKSSVAIVDANGKVTAIKEGQATIKVMTVDGEKSANCVVTVEAETGTIVSVTGVSLNTSSLSMSVGETQTLLATVSPSNATDKSVTWSSNNTSVVTVSSSGVVTAKAAGTAIVTVRTSDGGKTATCTITVSAAVVSVTGVSLDKTSLSMTVGDTQALTATITPSNATNKAVTWTSSNTSIATVSSSGVVAAKAAGSATITVLTNDGQYTAKCLVNVKASDISASHYLTFLSTGSSSLEMVNVGSCAPVLYYSTDKTHWTLWDYSALTFTSSSPINICGDNKEGLSTGMNNYCKFNISGSLCSCSGNIMSLINKDNSVASIPSAGCFRALFSGCALLTKAPELPATSLKEDCYLFMFENCSSLKEGPILSTTALQKNCYYGMFYMCTSLESAPVLPATSLAEGCYSYMFYGCESLRTAPVLLAKKLVNHCYSNMFNHCFNLTYIKCMATDISALSCTVSWVNGAGVSSTDEKVFVKDKSMTSWTRGFDGIPYGWTVQEE